MSTKNTKAIERIIAELALKDYLRVNGDKKPMGKRKPYHLSAETLEAKDIFADYLRDRISESEYKKYCLTYNLSIALEGGQATC